LCRQLCALVALELERIRKEHLPPIASPDSMLH
jgi:hypothetical protein